MLWRKLQRHINKNLLSSKRMRRARERSWLMVASSAAAFESEESSWLIQLTSMHLTQFVEGNIMFCVCLSCSGKVNKSCKISTYGDTEIYLHLIHQKMFLLRWASPNSRRHIQRDFMLCYLPENLLFIAPTPSALRRMLRRVAVVLIINSLA